MAPTLPGTDTAGTASCNSTKSTPTMTGDILGDWREEAVLRETNSANLRVYTTTNVTKRRIYTLMHDPTYRAQVNFRAVKLQPAAAYGLPHRRRHG
jgi:hypothetical protein